MNQLRSISKLISQQLGCFFIYTFIIRPMNEVQEFAILVLMVDLGVEDIFDLILSSTIDVEQRWQSLQTIWDCVRCCRF